MSFKFFLLFFFWALISGCSKNVFLNNPLFSTDPSPPLLASPILSTLEAIGLGTLYKEGGIHRGIDVKFKEGAKVKTSAAGIITAITESRDNFGPIISVNIKYNKKYDVFYVFEPLKELYFSVGDYVGSGEVIGKVGSREVEGTVGSWLHFEVDNYGEPNCPMLFLDRPGRQEFRTLYNLNPTVGLTDPCYEHPSGCPSLHF